MIVSYSSLEYTKSSSSDTFNRFRLYVSTDDEDAKPVYSLSFDKGSFTSATLYRYDASGVKDAEMYVNCYGEADDVALYTDGHYQGMLFASSDDLSEYQAYANEAMPTWKDGTRLAPIAAAAIPEPTATPIACDYSVSGYGELLDALWDAALAQKAEFSIRFEDSDLYDAFVNDSNVRYEALRYAGIAYWNGTSSGSQVITLQPTEYFPGMKMALAWSSGDTSGLTDREKKALSSAEKLVKRAVSKKKSDVTNEKAIHDLLVKQVTYVARDSFDLSDGSTAVGALLDGKADSYGYADAFFLLSTIAGLNVRYLALYDNQRDCEVMVDLIQLGDSWYLVDVASDDPDVKSKTLYRRFNLSSNFAAFFYDWSTELFSGRLADVACSDYLATGIQCYGTGSAVTSLDDASTLLSDFYKQNYKSGYHVLVFCVSGDDMTTDALSALHKKAHLCWTWEIYGYRFCEYCWY